MVAIRDAAAELADSRREVARACQLARASLVVRSEFDLDLDDPAELRVVYATVLREGSEDDVRTWIHQPTLLTIWDSLWLPSAVHDAWDGWIQEHRLHVAV